MSAQAQAVSMQKMFAVSSALLVEHFAAGGDWAWLSAADEAARALYAKVGFQDAGVQLNYIDTAESQPTG
jgi:hypothetical protein